MRRVIGAAVAAIALAFAGSASAAVILHHEAGSTRDISSTLTAALWQPFLVDGEIEITLTFTPPGPATITPYMYYWSHRRYPDGRVETMIWEDYFTLGTSGQTREWDWTSNIGELVLKLRDPGYACEDWQAGTTCYWATPLSIGWFGNENTAIDYDLTISRSAVPEPATWAMMIIGFGLTGVTIRRRSPNRPRSVLGHRDL